MPCTPLHSPHLLLLLLSCLVSAVYPTPRTEGCLLCTEVLMAPCSVCLPGCWPTGLPAESTLGSGDGLLV